MPASQVMHEWKHGQLHSGSKQGPIVKDRAQAVAIMLSEKRKEGRASRQAGGETSLMGHGFGGAPMVPPMAMPPTPPTPPSGFNPQPQFGAMRPPGYQGGGMAGLSPGWIERQEARNITHVGPVNSAVPGRTDRHNISVPSGSYVFPSEFVSHLGQNNTAAGMNILGRMFGGTPYGIGNVGIRHGAGAPHVRAPHAGKMAGLGGLPGASSIGGGKDGNRRIGEPTEVEVAGGEYIAPPEAVMRVVGTNDIKHAHNVLDHWVMKRRKDHIKTLQKLPPPAKS